MSDEGFYDPELHSIDADERVLHVPVCSVGAVKTVWNDLLGTGTGDWNVSALRNHVVSLMEKNLGKDRAHRRAFAKEADLPAWFETETPICFILSPPPFSFLSNSCMFAGTQIKLCSLARCTLGAIFLIKLNWWRETRSWIGSTVCCGKFQGRGRSLGGEWWQPGGFETLLCLCWDVVLKIYVFLALPPFSIQDIFFFSFVVSFFPL